MRMPGVGLIYAGLIAVLVAAASLIKPLAFLGIRTRPRGALVLGIGLIVAAVGAFLPARDTRVEAIRTHLDEFAPVFQFNEVHRIQVRAPRNRVYRAIKEVTADEILLFRTLTWLRRLGRPGPESILNAPERLPLQGLQEQLAVIEQAVETASLMLGGQKSRGYCLEMICADFLAGASLEDPTPKTLSSLISRVFEFLPAGDKQELLLALRDCA